LSNSQSQLNWIIVGVASAGGGSDGTGNQAPNSATGLIVFGKFPSLAPIPSPQSSEIAARRSLVDCWQLIAGARTKDGGERAQGLS
jgi:hypothetical protein